MSQPCGEWAEPQKPPGPRAALAATCQGTAPRALVHIQLFLGLWHPPAQTPIQHPMQLICTLELGREAGQNQVSIIRSCYLDHSRLQDKNCLWSLSHTSSEVSGQVQAPQDMGSSISTHPGGAGSVWAPEEGSPHSLHLHLLPSHRWHPAFPAGLAAPHSQHLHW